MNNIDYINRYFSFISDELNSLDIKCFNEFVNILNKIKLSKKKVILLGNGGSAAMSSHVSVDLTKNANMPKMLLSYLRSR